MRENGEIMDFSQRMRELLGRKKWSASALSRDMGYASRNSFFRVLNNESSYAKQKEFFGRLQKIPGLKISEKDLRYLAEGLEVTRLGPERAASHQQMRALLLRRKDEEEALIFSGIRGQTRDAVAEIDALFRASGELYISQCVSRPLFSMLATCLKTAREAGGYPQIYHLLDGKGQNAAEVIDAIFPLFYDHAYTAYIPKDGMKAEMGAGSGSWMLGVWHDGDRDRSLMVSEVTPGCYRAAVIDGREVVDFEREVFQEKIQKMRPLKTAFAKPASMEDYVWLARRYGELEEDTEQYNIRYDVPINAVSPEIARSVMANTLRDLPNGEELLDAFAQVQEKRFLNTFKKHKVTHIILSIPEMQRFARTGRHSDHFFGMRPYTAWERRRILQTLRDQTSSNPYFSLYFLRPGEEPANQDVILYGGKGVLFTVGETDYRLDGGHSEAMVTQEAFCQGYRDFFLNELLQHHVSTSQETVAILDKLIALCAL